MWTLQLNLATIDTYFSSGGGGISCDGLLGGVFSFSIIASGASGGGNGLTVLVSIGNLILVDFNLIHGFTKIQRTFSPRFRKQWTICHAHSIQLEFIPNWIASAMPINGQFKIKLLMKNWVQDKKTSFFFHSLFDHSSVRTIRFFIVSFGCSLDTHSDSSIDKMFAVVINRKSLNSRAKKDGPISINPWRRDFINWKLLLPMWQWSWWANRDVFLAFVIPHAVWAERNKEKPQSDADSAREAQQRSRSEENEQEQGRERKSTVIADSAIEQ